MPQEVDKVGGAISDFFKYLEIIVNLNGGLQLLVLTFVSVGFIAKTGQ